MSEPNLRRHRERQERELLFRHPSFIHNADFVVSIAPIPDKYENNSGFRHLGRKFCSSTPC